MARNTVKPKGKKINLKDLSIAKKLHEYERMWQDQVLTRLNRFWLRDNGRGHQELWFSHDKEPQFVGRIVYNLPNKFTWDGRTYYVETPYSSYDEEYHIYELSLDAHLGVKFLRIEDDKSKQLTKD